ncbi:PRD domain-containing protein [Enterococcus thailandicus]|uniref:PRD domain-containing protein n=1 Tax=Enterococcus thailandicus TaxID=417368 RepID=UPI002890E276|nr:PRD domain-containing protein [Enterococcus thailandicus]MDT2751558.1 PRD domain-containing protein [Enterococcus thailandicus]MDT2776334.1 PRD domain-containing protein [Enterococcus thailandicus]MDT2794957.1 PRD domain-containing protein [Enterococcus thailandicus]
MEIIKSINNNFALAMKDGKEVIVAEVGIGFGKFPKTIAEDEVEKVYQLNDSNLNGINLAQFPLEVMNYSHQIVKKAEQELQLPTTDLLFFNVADHTNYMLQRLDQGISLSAPFRIEIEKFFPKEFELGNWAVNYLAEETGKQIPRQEAHAYALHFINSQASLGEREKVDPYIKIISDVNNIITYHFHKEFPEDSFYYLRFVTHLKYFIARKLNHETTEYRKNELYQTLRAQYVQEAQCVKKIEHYLQESYGWTLDEEDLLYLLIHIKKISEI